MKEIGTLYRVNGEVLRVNPDNGKIFMLDELQIYVGGYIELVPGTGKKGEPPAYCNEEGRLNGLKLNDQASIRFAQVLVGDVIQVRKEKS